MERLWCIALGYLLGSFLTAELVSRRAAGKPCAEIGSGNPGMANIMAQLGFGAGAAVLAGDAAKTVLAVGLSGWLWGGALGHLALLYGGFGAALGHDFPAWRRFRGGKSVAVTVSALILFSPLWGTLAAVAGMLVVFFTGWLPLGAVLIPLLFVPAAFAVYGAEAGMLAAALALLMLALHRDGLARVLAGREPPHAKLLGRREAPQNENREK